MNKTYTLSTLDYLRGNCPHEGCKHNNAGECQCVDGDFLLSVIEDIQGAVEDELDGLNTATFDCYYAEAEDGVCMHCGNALDRLEEDYPYGSTTTKSSYYACRYCD